MKIIFSRKGFDTSAGGGPSPIVDGRPISLPIPCSKGIARTTYAELGLGELAESASRGKVRGSDLCHHDPMFLENGTALLGQGGAAQTHLERQGVTLGDVFLFFGLFRDPEAKELHHRIFGYLEVDQIVALKDGAPDDMVALKHPHALQMYSTNDVIWSGEGGVAQRASEALRLTAPGAPASLWQRPAWLRRGGLSYHDRPERWLRGRLLQSALRGQEFVADIGRRSAPRIWLDAVIDEIKAS